MGVATEAVGEGVVMDAVSSAVCMVEKSMNGNRGDCGRCGGSGQADLLRLWIVVNGREQ